ncbi:kinase-like protein, partial [Caulochytrium protostelioides]
MWLFKGSALLANLDVHEQTQLASGGPSYVWVVHGARKKNTNQTVALFTFHKSYQETLNPLAAKNPSQKREQDEVNQLLRQEVQKLSRLRHPTILEVNEPLEDLRSAMVFATEPVLCNLGNLFGNTANFANGHPRHLGRGYELDEVELPRGILQIGRALEFLHRHRIVHTNISPASIFVNEKGDWKLGGFAFCVTLPPGAAQTAECIASQYPPICSPDLDFVAPEIVLNSQCAAESDLFSLGCLIYALYHQGRSPLDTAGNESRYRDELPRLASKDLRGIPADLQPMVRRLCATERSARPSIDEFNQCGYFSSLLIKTIHYLDTLTLKTQVEKAQFLKGLNQVLPQFSARTLRLKILSSLLLELKDPVIAPFLLPNIFYIVEQQPPDAPETRAMLRDVVFPAIKPVFTLTEPPQAAVLLLSRIDMLRKRAYPSSEEFRAHVWPLIWASLSTTSITVLTQACKSIAHFADDFDYATITSSLWPRFAFLYKETQNVGLKTGVLIAVYALMKHLDKTFLVETVLPLMIQPSRPRDAGLIMACLAIWEEAAKSLSRQQVAHHIMTELWMSCLAPALQPSQYKRFMTVIHALTEKLEREHTSHLETVKSVE